MKSEERVALFRKKHGYEPRNASQVCPKWDSCQINKCPLHPDYQELFNDSSDPAMKHKQKCIPKSIRKYIGTYFKLSNLGLTSREFSSAKKWESLSPEEQKLKIAKIKEVSPVSRLLAKGCVIIPPNANDNLKPHTKDEKSSKNDIQTQLSEVENADN